MAVWLIWLVLSGVLIAAELMTLSLYLLLAGFGALLAAGLAIMDLPLNVQIMTAALVTLGGWALLSFFRPQKKHPDSRTNPDLNMDIGANVRIAAIDADGKISVQLRGARWDAKIAHDHAPDLTAVYKIIRIDGSVLIIHPEL